MVINYSEKQLSNMKSSYRFVFGLTAQEVAMKEHQARMVDAIRDVYQYPGNFENETQVLADTRRNIQTDPATDFIQALGNHFKMLYPGRFKNKSVYKILYEIYSSMNSSKATTGEIQMPVNKVDAATTGQPDVNDDSDKTNKNEITDKERKENNMAVRDAHEQMNEMKQEIDNLRQGTQNGGGTDAKQEQAKTLADLTGAAAGPQVVAKANVTSSSATEKATRATLDSQKSKRLAVSQAATATTIVLSTPPQKERLVNSANPMGHIDATSWERTYNKFVELTGYNAETGEFSGEKLVAGEEANAKAMLDLLMRAKADPSTEIKINESKSEGSVKGFRLRKPDSTEEYLTKEEIRSYVYNETAGYLPTSCAGTTITLATAKGVNPNNKSKASDKMVDVSQIKDPGQIMILKIANRKQMLETKGALEYWREKTTETEEQNGCKSEAYVKCKKLNKKKNEMVPYTYRIPLKAMMYKTEVVNEQIKEKFGEAGSLGTHFDINSQEDVNKQLDILATIVNLMATSDVKDTLASDIKNMAAEEEAAKVSEDEKAFA